MSDLLNSASLVMIPSGYKEDVVYSQIPTDGSGDLSFTRASNGTRINSAGLVEVTPWNLFQQSNTFNTTWLISGTGTVTSGATDPFGGTSAWTLAKTAANTFLYQSTAGFSGSATFSIYAKAGTVDQVWINHAQSGAFSAFFDLTLGTTFGSAGCVATIVSVGGGWFRCSISGTVTSPINLRIYPASGGSISGTTGNILIYGAQGETGALKPYFPTTDRLNVPRLTYQNGGGGCPSLLLEKQSTNLATQSTITSFGSGTNDWSNGLNNPASINQTTGIDGTQNGAKYTKTAGETTGDYFLKRSVPVTSGTTYTISGYIKLGTASNAVIVINNTTAWDTVANGSIVCSTANGFSTTAWKRFELTITAPASNQINIHYGYNLETGVTAQATGTFFLDGLQVEAGSYATSLINTTSSSATRVVDACYKTGISSLIGQTEGVVFIEMTPISTITTYTERLIKIYGGGQEIGLQRYADSRLVGYGYLGGASNEWTFDIANVFTSTTQSVKIAMAYSSNDVVLYVNGIQKGTDTSASMFSSLSALAFAEDIAGDLLCSQNIKQAVLFPTRLTNAELASLTTI